MKEVMEYAGALVIGGLVFLMLIGAYNSIERSAMAGTLKTIVQSDFSSATDAIEYDFRKIGYAVADTIVVTVPDSMRVSFKSDIDDIGVVDSITYYLDPGPDPSSTNPAAHVLYRVKDNNPPAPFAHGVTSFLLSYFDASGNVTSIPRNIRRIRVQLAMEGTTAVDTRFPGVCWDRTFRPKNLR